ncbi:MAG: DUF898 family protein [Pseudomonadota bacterium]
MSLRPQPAYEVSSRNGAPEDLLYGRYTGTTGALLILAVKTGFLTVVTLGVYRFWARTRIRRYVWSATAPGGEPFEYTGTGLEKLLGFLIAVVAVAFALGGLQILLFFLGLSMFSGSDDETGLLPQIAATQASLLVLLPLIFFAQYRARRYRLSRTRWRGIRFGMDQGAAGYMWRALGHGMLTLATLGLLLPRQTFWLTKYKIDRTRYGDAYFHQAGRWQMLYPAMRQLIIAVAILVALVGAGFVMQNLALALVGIIVGPLWFVIGIASYRINCLRIMADHLSLGRDVRFRCDVRTSSIVTKIVIGGMLVSIVAGIASAIFAAFAELLIDPEILISGQAPGPLPIVFGIVGILFLFALYGALGLVFIVQPVYARIVETTALINASAVTGIRQSRQDDAMDAEGFADALDVGGAF